MVFLLDSSHLKYIEFFKKTFLSKERISIVFSNAYVLWFSFDRYDSPRSMSRTTLITSPFIFFPSYTISVFFYTCLPQPSAVHQFQVLELCRISVYRCVLGLFSSWETWRGWLQKIYLLLETIAVDSASGPWVVSGRSLEPLSGHRPSRCPNRPWSCYHNCLVSCKINTLLYIFREQKSAAIGFKIFILNTFPKQITPRKHFEYPSHIFGSVKYTF